MENVGQRDLLPNATIGADHLTPLPDALHPTP